MADDNVELVRKLHEHWDPGEYIAAAEWFDPSVEFVRVGSGSDLDGEWRGLPEMWAAMGEYAQAWEDLRLKPERFIDLGDRVLVLATEIGRGRHSGVIVEREEAFLFTVRDHKIVRFECYWDRAEAMRTAGLGQ